jgi:hypothetical protein
MRRSDYTAEPPAAARYFGPDAGREHADIRQVFHPTRGWTAYTSRHRHPVTVAWARSLRRTGYTAVALASAGRLADFTTAELTRRTAP